MPRAAALALVALGAGCGNTTAPSAPDAGARGVVVVGVQAQAALGGAAASFRIRARVRDELRADRLLVANGSQAALPFELRLDEPAGSAVDVDVQAFPTVDGSGAPLLTRLARTDVPAGAPEAARLLRVRLEAECAALGDATAVPSCAAPQTCVRARCVDPYVPAEDLEPYRPAWAVDEPDACKPAGAGPPELVLGTGQTDYGALADGATLEAERGPQGGHHLWIALRVKNMKQEGSTVTVTARQPDTGVETPATGFVFAFEPDEGGWCKLFGLRYQLDNAATPIEGFLGRPLDVTIEVTDVTGAKATATRRVNVAATVRG